ncbi:MAG TPA: glycosyltransferase family 4 protein [Cyclobacteriaceae bacterium]|nr:glycosyltransferase family 4 protein [Cyclobacteriaceae bacterium]
MKLLVISDNYPGPDLIYGDVFVHARVLAYQRSVEVMVSGCDPGLATARNFDYEGVRTHITSSVKDFRDVVRLFNPDVIAVHFITPLHLPVLLETEKPMVVFCHGLDVTSWRRRLMNYNGLGALPYLWKFINENRKQLAAVRQLVMRARHRKDIQFVFVSRWLQTAAGKDLGMDIPNANIIANGIDMNRFGFQPDVALRRNKVLLMRSFRARNYANDLSVNAILHLSEQPIFKSLEFTLYGEGYLFKPLTAPLRKFSNVVLHERFVPNTEMPAIHRAHGIFLCLSRLDSQGVSMGEAMSGGLVPVASPIGGIPEFVQDGKSGFLVPDASSAADRITWLATHEKEFSSFSLAAREAVRTTCDLSVTSTRELELMRSLRP